MIELPEATIIARQINRQITGRRVKIGNRGNTPHKWAFVTGSPEEYARILPGKIVAGAAADGSHVAVMLDPGYVLVLGGGGERILYHRTADTLPAKHQLFLEFDDGTFFTVSVMGWGSVKLCALDKPYTTCGTGKGLGPVDKGFTPAYLSTLIDSLDPDDKRSVKYFAISEPGVWGVGNGCLQDILFSARIHPRTPVVSLSSAQRKALHRAIFNVISRAIKAGGRDGEVDLFGKSGRYRRVLSAETAGKPCPRCGTRIARESFLGGAIYFCPECQPAPVLAKRTKLAGTKAAQLI